jgi:membrane protein
MTRSVTESNRSGSAAPIGDGGRPDSPAELSKASWGYVVRKTLREFSRDQCTDLAAALTYYAVLALFPAAIALLSLVGLFGQGPKTVDTLMNIVSGAGGSSVANTLRPTLETLSTPRLPALGSSSACWARCGRRQATSVRSGAR